MSVSIPPVFNPYALPVVTPPRHAKDHQGDQDGEPRRGDEHHRAPTPPASGESSAAPASPARRQTVGTIINVRG